MKILYLTSLENTYGNEIHRNQVLNLDGHGVDYTFLFLSPLFIFNKKGFSINRNKFSNRNNVIEIKLPLFSFNFCLHILLIPIYLIVATVPFLFVLNRVRPNVVHCRNMLSTLLAYVCKTLFSLRYKIVCDPRSVYVEECVIQKYFKFNGFNYKLWKILEKFLYKKSNACVGLSEYFREYLSEYNVNSFFIPAIVNEKAVFSQQKRIKLRAQFSLSSKDKVICYIGSIGTWHSIEKLEQVIKWIIKEANSKFNIKIILLTGNSIVTNRIAKLFKNNVLVSGRVSPDKVIDYLTISDFGLLPGSDKIGFCYELLYKTMISSKAEEYLVAGLPIIVNSRISSVAHYVNDNCAGVTIGDSFLNKNFNRDHICKDGISLFGVSNVVIKYKQLYELICMQ